MLFPPEADEGGLVIAHDGAGVGAADEGTAAMAASCVHVGTHAFLQNEMSFPGQPTR
jgi:hypothetical protein